MSWGVPPGATFSLNKGELSRVSLSCIVLCCFVCCLVHCSCIAAFAPIADDVLSCDVHLQGHVIMMTQPQSIYQRVIDKTKGLAFQAQFLDQSIDKRLQLAQSVMSKTLAPQAVCQCVCVWGGDWVFWVYTFSLSFVLSLPPYLPLPPPPL